MENPLSPTPESPSSQPSPLSRLSGPDGKPLEQAQPNHRPMPSRREKYNMCFMMFTLMTREERKGLRKALKLMQARLDLMYPNGMTEEDIKNDLAKAANEIVPEEQGNAEPQAAEVSPKLDVPVQPEGDTNGAESAAAVETGGVE